MIEDTLRRRTTWLDAWRAWAKTIVGDVSEQWDESSGIPMPMDLGRVDGVYRDAISAKLSVAWRGGVEALEQTVLSLSALCAGHVPMAVWEQRRHDVDEALRQARSGPPRELPRPEHESAWLSASKVLARRATALRDQVEADRQAQLAAARSEGAREILDRFARMKVFDCIVELHRFCTDGENPQLIARGDYPTEEEVRGWVRDWGADGGDSSSMTEAVARRAIHWERTRILEEADARERQTDAIVDRIVGEAPDERVDPLARYCPAPTHAGDRKVNWRAKPQAVLARLIVIACGWVDDDLRAEPVAAGLVAAIKNEENTDVPF